MRRVIISRLLRLAATLLAVTFLTFSLTALLPGDPVNAILGVESNQDPEVVAEIREDLGLDDPFLLRYLTWLGDALQGDLGKSYITDQDVMETITQRVPVTAQLAFMAILMALILAVPIGILGAYKQSRWQDTASSAGVQVALSIPNFIIGIFLIWLFAVQLQWLPSSNWNRISDKGLVENLKTAILPATALAMTQMAIFSRLVRADMVATLQENYILAAKAKGMNDRFILFRHALRPSSLSLMTIVGINFGALLGGTVVIETLFAVPGLGFRLINAINQRDILVIQGITVFVAAVYVIINTVVDLLYAVIDPRIPEGLTMSTTEANPHTPDFPRDRISPVSTAVQPGSVQVGRPKRARPLQIFRDMPVLVKLSAVWLAFIILGAIYAKLDQTVFDGALPLQDPNFQTNNFNPDTGEFGTGEPLEPSSTQHWLGTDAIARDTFARILHGGWVSLIVAMVSATFGIVVGGLLGSLVGFVRGKTETAVMSMIDVILAFPALILLLALVSIFEVRDLFLISVVIGVLSIPAYTRVSRANSLAISNREFVMAARAIGTKPRSILFREIIPNVLPTLIAYAMVASAFVIVVEGSLSFLGLSVQLPTSTWGNMINQARGDIKVNAMQVLWPSLGLSLTVLSLNQVGDFFQKRGSVRGSAL